MSVGKLSPRKARCKFIWLNTMERNPTNVNFVVQDSVRKVGIIHELQKLALSVLRLLILVQSQWNCVNLWYYKFVRGI